MFLGLYLLYLIFISHYNLSSHFLFRFINSAKNISVYHMSDIVWTYLLRLFVNYNLRIVTTKQSTSATVLEHLLLEPNTNKMYYI